MKLQGLANYAHEHIDDPYAGTYTEPTYEEQQAYELANIHADLDQGDFEDEYLEDTFESDVQEVDNDVL
jgi:hypothetical protein